ncbi:MAG: ATP-binding protein [Spirochaetia bacterium]
MNREILLMQAISNAYFKYDENEVYPELLSIVMQEMGGNFGLFAYIEELNRLTCHTAELNSDSGGLQHEVTQFDPPQWQGLWGHLAEKESIEKHYSPIEAVAEQTAPAYYLNAPLFFQKEFLGFIQLESNSNNFSDEDVESMRKILRYIAPIQYAWYENKLQRQKTDVYLRKLKRSETKYRSLFTLSPDMIFLNTAEGKILDVNQAGAQLLGYDSPKEIIGTYAQDYYFDSAARSKLKREMDQKGYVKNLEIILQTKAGEKVFCIENAHRVINSKQTGYVYQGIIHDITNRIEQEKLVLQQNLELSEANKNLREARNRLVQKEKMASIGQLSAGIAHEINNPLGFVKSNYTSLKRYMESIKRFLTEYSQSDREAQPALKKRYEEEEIDFILDDLQAIFSETEDGIRRIMSIVSNLKSFSRSGTDETLESYDINAGIESTLIIARNEYKYVAVIEKHLQKLPGVPCNANEINQVVLNLLVNAAHAVSEGKTKEGVIRIDTWADDTHVYCRISDNGPGIPAAIRSKIFDPFFTTKKTGRGTGLGLSISYDIIVNRHGGSIELETEEGQGARFTFALPIRPVREGGQKQNE